MHEWDPIVERRALTSSTPNYIVQCPCRIPIIWPPAVPKQVFIHVLRYFGRKVIADRPHRTNHTSVSPKQHACCDMDCLVREVLVSLGRLTCGEKGEHTTGTLQYGHVPQLQTASIGETESTWIGRNARGPVGHQKMRDGSPGVYWTTQRNVEDTIL